MATNERQVFFPEFLKIWFEANVLLGQPRLDPPSPSIISNPSQSALEQQVVLPKFSQM
jgi:hypothetical protein